MTHRQWKKNFKKKHHRNPFWFEDKRERQRRQASAIITGYSKCIGTIYDGIQNAMPYLREGLDRFARAVTKAANEVTKSVTRAFDEEIVQAFETAEQSEFLKGGNDRNWNADFDWIMTDRNLPRILEGKYNSKFEKPSMQQSRKNTNLDAQYMMMAQWAQEDRDGTC